MRTTFGIAAAAALLAQGCAAAAAAGSWIGMSPDYGSGVVDLFNLQGKAERGANVATVPISQQERVAVDSFRCRPGGTFCLFTTTNSKDSSWLYNVSLTSGVINSKTALPNMIAHNLHVDMASGAAYTVALGTSSVKIIQVYAGAITDLIDLSSHFGANDTVPVGGTTQCSDTDIMWVGIKSGSAGEPDRVITTHLPTRNVSGVRSLTQPLPTSLWASCQDSTKVNKLGGIAMLGGRPATFGYVWINESGGFDVVESAPVPTGGAPVVLSGLLSEPPFTAYFTALYPATAEPGDDVQGFVAFGTNRAGAALSVSPINYYLTGAAAVF